MADQQLAERVVRALAARSETVSTCESLTAGLLSATIVDVPGASAVLQGGLITYSAELKHRLAGVDMEIIESAGVISSDCAEAMAHGARRECLTTWAIALTGVAGPTQQDGHPVGEMWVAITGPDNFVQCELVQPEAGGPELADCDRVTLRQRCVTYALEMLLRTITVD